ncbi:MAG: hypothetical protein V1797_07210 [Pseudomonadota bacterium]
MAARTRRARGKAGATGRAGADCDQACGPTLCQLAADPFGEIAAEVGADLVSDGSCEGLSETLAQANLAQALAAEALARQRGKGRDSSG